MRFQLNWMAVLLCTGVALGLSANPPRDLRKTGAVVPAGKKVPAESTLRMARLLKHLADEVDITQVPVLVNDRLAESFRQKLAGVTDWKHEPYLLFNLAVELLNSGQNSEAIAALNRLDQVAKQHNLTVKREDRLTFRMIRIQAYMRMGEEANCCANHNPESCLIPLQGEAIYKHQDGPRNAIRLLEEQLAEEPGDLTARWLLNICHMTLGEYPDKVPKRWVVDPKVFESDYELKRFPEVAISAGLDTYGLSGGCLADDFNGDGQIDIVRSDIGLTTQLRFFHNNGDGTFADRTKEAGLIGIVGGLNVTSADFDNDGHLDILVLRGGWMGSTARSPKSLLRNNGDGTFTDVTVRAGLMVAHPTQAATWLDYDGDGWLDIFVGNESTVVSDPHPCELFRNNGDGTFTECAAATGIRVFAFVKGVTSGDYNNDGRPDIYISQRGLDGANILLRNDGPLDPADPALGWRFTDVTQTAGLAKPMVSFPCWFYDYDNDGQEDIFVCGYAGGVAAVMLEYLGQPSDGEHPRLYRNNGDGTFTNVAPEMGLNQTILGMAANFGDLDNDGFLDCYIGTGDPAFTSLFPNRMFRNAGGKRFQDVTTSGGFGHLQKGHGIAFADVNNDGQQDIYEVMGGAYSGDKYYSVLYANPGHDNRWITLKLEGVQSNRSAIGARVRVTVATAEGERTIHRTVNTGASFGASPLRQQIGLGAAESIKGFEIFWPTTGKTQRLPGVPMDGYYTIKEGAAAAVPFKLKSFPLKAPVEKLSAQR